MIFTKSKSKLVTVIIHLLIWAVFGTIYFTQPLSWRISVPYQLWVKNGLILCLLVVAYYLNAIILVPRFLLKNHTGIYLLIVIGVVAIVVILNSYIDYWLNLHQLLDEAFHKLGPPRHHKMDHQWDVSMIVAMISTSALVIGISTSIITIEKWQYDKQKHQEM